MSEQQENINTIENNTIECENIFQNHDRSIKDNLIQAIETAVEPIISKHYRSGHVFLAIKSEHGQRKILTINAFGYELSQLLRGRNTPSDSNNPIAYKNRPIDPKHVEEIKEYIRNRAKANRKWVLGAITANINPNQITYQPLWRDYLYLLVIPNGVSLDITDGQHRRRAILEMIDADHYDRDIVTNQTFPINLVLEGNLEQCQIDFHDMAQGLQIPQTLLVAYSGKGRDLIARRLVNEVNMFQDKTNLVQKTPGSKSKYIYSANYISKLTSAVFKGNSSSQLSDYTEDDKVNKAVNNLAYCLNHFFSINQHTIKIAEKKELTSQEASKFKDNYLLAMSVGLEILGLLIHQTLNEDDTFDLDKVTQIATEINWSRTAEIWSNNVVNGKKISAGKGYVQDAYKTALNQLGW